MEYTVPQPTTMTENETKLLTATAIRHLLIHALENSRIFIEELPRVLRLALVETMYASRTDQNALRLFLWNISPYTLTEENVVEAILEKLNDPSIASYFGAYIQNQIAVSVLDGHWRKSKSTINSAKLQQPVVSTKQRIAATGTESNDTKIEGDNNSSFVASEYYRPQQRQQIFRTIDEEFQSYHAMITEIFSRSRKIEIMDMETRMDFFEGIHKCTSIENLNAWTLDCLDRSTIFGNSDLNTVAEYIFKARFDLLLFPVCFDCNDCYFPYQQVTTHQFQNHNNSQNHLKDAPGCTAIGISKNGGGTGAQQRQQRQQQQPSSSSHMQSLNSGQFRSLNSHNQRLYASEFESKETSSDTGGGVQQKQHQQKHHHYQRDGPAHMRDHTNHQLLFRSSQSQSAYSSGLAASRTSDYSYGGIGRQRVHNQQWQQYNSSSIYTSGRTSHFPSLSRENELTGAAIHSHARQDQCTVIGAVGIENGRKEGKDCQQKQTHENSCAHATDESKEEKCPVCLGENKRELFLPCTHGFCAPCINNWIRRRGDVFPCPICRLEVKRGKNDICTKRSPIRRLLRGWF